MNVGVFLSSRTPTEYLYIEASKELGKAIVKCDTTLIYGGANVGLMGCMADSVLQNGGQAIGVMPKPLSEQEIIHPNLTKLYEVDSMAARKQMMFELADAFIVMPGGLGTLEELFELWNASKIGLNQKPFGFFNVNNHFDLLFKYLERSIEDNFMGGNIFNKPYISGNCYELIQKLKQAITSI